MTLIGSMWLYTNTHPIIFITFGIIVFLISFVMFERSKALNNSYQHYGLIESIGPSMCLGLFGVLLMMLWPIVLGISSVIGTCWLMSKGIERYYSVKPTKSEIIESIDNYEIQAAEEIEKVLNWEDITHGRETKSSRVSR